MCGIAGVFDPDRQPSPDEVAAMVATLMHRGPDSWGVHAGRGGVIGQSRLAIIDLVTGDPPITDSTGRVGAALNGEIYNFRDLRRDLERDGCAFKTTGDTEVAAQLAARVGAGELASLLDGMFALAVLDDREGGRLTLVRDRFGKKPLHYWTDGRRLVFGSEIKALLAHPLVPVDLDPDALPAYLTFGYVPTPRTFYRGIQSLPPGHVLTADGGGVRVERYWRLPVAGVDGVEPLDIGEGEAVELVRSLLGDAVERRLVADVPLGAFLSGGIDSSTVVALMAERTTTPVRTFTIGFVDDAGFDERPYAQAVARRFGTDHTEFVVEPHEIDLVERLVEAHDQPFGDSSALPTYLLSELTRRHVTVALSGDGGDELFAGYERFFGAILADRLGVLPGPVMRAARATLALGGHRSGLATKADRFLRRADLGLPDALRSWISYVQDEERAALLPGGSEWALDDYRARWAESDGAPTLARVLDLNARTYLLDDLLPKIDRTSMACSLEVRSPFLDTALAEVVFRLPPRLHVRGRQLKHLLKAAMRGTVPDDILDRPKRGFGIPLDRWFRDDLGAHVTSMLGDGARVRAHLQPAAVDAVLAAHASGSASHGHVLWTLLTLELFLRKRGW